MPQRRRGGSSEEGAAGGYGGERDGDQGDDGVKPDCGACAHRSVSLQRVWSFLEEGDGAGDGGHGQCQRGDDAVELECLLLHLFAPLLSESALAAVGRRTLFDLPLDCVSCRVLHSFNLPACFL